MPACGGSSSSGGVVGGGNWSYANTHNLSLLLPEASGYPDDVSQMDCEHVQLDASGRMHVIWTEDDQVNTMLWYSRSQGGASWSTPLRVNNTSPNEFVLAAGPDGTGYVVFTASDDVNGSVYLKRVTLTQTQFAVLNVSQGPTVPTAADEAALTNNFPFDPRVLVGSDGIVHIFWQEDDNAGFTQVWHRAFNPTTGALSASIESLTLDAGLDGVAGNGDFSFNGGNYDVALDSSNNVLVLFDVDVDDSTDDLDADGAADAADVGVDRDGLRTRFRPAGFAGVWAASEEALEGMAAVLGLNGATFVTRYRVESVQLALDSSGRFHLCALLDTDNDFQGSEVVYDRRGAGAASTWGAAGGIVNFERVNDTADVPGGNLAHIDEFAGGNEMFCMGVNATNGTVHIAWIDRDNTAVNTWFLRYKRRLVTDVAGFTALSTLLDSDIGTNSSGDVMVCGVDLAGNFTVAYERNQGSGDTLYAATVSGLSTFTFNPVSDLREVARNQGGYIDLVCADFRSGNAIIMWDFDEQAFGTNAVGLATKSNGVVDWVVSLRVDGTVDQKNGLPDDGWNQNAEAVIIAGGLYHVFFDQFATHPEPVDSVNDLAVPSTGGGFGAVLFNDPQSYVDPNPQPDSYDLFHISSSQ